MATYMINWQANPAVWPTDPNEVLAVLETTAAGGDMMLANGSFTDIRWTSNTSGYAVAECASKADAVALCTPFFPWFSQTIDEAVPWNEGRDAVLAGARQMAGTE